MKYMVCNPDTHVILGIYDAESSMEAIETCVRDAGYDSVAHMCEEIGCELELIATEVEHVGI